MINSLSSLKNKLEDQKVEIMDFCGHTLITALGTFTLGPENLYLDGKVVTKEEFKKMVPKWKNTAE